MSTDSIGEDVAADFTVRSYSMPEKPTDMIERVALANRLRPIIETTIRYAYRAGFRAEDDVEKRDELLRSTVAAILSEVDLAEGTEAAQVER